MQNQEGQQTQLNALLTAGLEQVGMRRPLIFRTYTRVVLPLDGYVFWSPIAEILVEGTLHFAQEISQEDIQTYGRMTVNFTTNQRITQLGSLGENTLCLASIGETRFAFSAHGAYQSEAGLWHYSGNSIEPSLLSQLLDPPRTLDPTQAIVSNSLPAWLALNGWSTPFEDWFSNAPVAQGGLGLTLYPSFVVPPNLPPPYVVVHIGPEDTRADQAIPFLDANRSSWQLARDHVRLTLYGLNNSQATDFLNCIVQYIEYTGNFGLSSMPIVKDGKRGQTELQAIAMQKFIDLDVSYQQSRIADIARTLIESASAQVQINRAA